MFKIVGCRDSCLGCWDFLTEISVKLEISQKFETESGCTSCRRQKHGSMIHMIYSSWNGIPVEAFRNISTVVGRSRVEFECIETLNEYRCNRFSKKALPVNRQTGGG